MTIQYQKVEIFVNGEMLPKAHRPLFELQNALVMEGSTVVICDGGVRHASTFEYLNKKLIWIGDFDSTNSLIQNDFEIKIKKMNIQLQKIILEKNKNESDFGAALDLISNSILGDFPLVVELFGTLGGRFDHALITFQEIFSWIQSRKHGTCAVSDFGVVSNVPFSLHLANNSVFSLFTTNPLNENVFLEGSLYAGEIKLARPSHGLSNVVCLSPIQLNPRNQTVALLWNDKAADASK